MIRKSAATGMLLRLKCANEEIAINNKMSRQQGQVMACVCGSDWGVDWVIRLKSQRSTRLARPGIHEMSN
jgi:hypothetical protein